MNKHKWFGAGSYASRPLVRAILATLCIYCTDAFVSASQGPKQSNTLIRSFEGRPTRYYGKNQSSQNPPTFSDVLESWMDHKGINGIRLQFSGDGDNAFSSSRHSNTSPNTSLPQKLFAECLGTYLIVQLGCGVVCSAKYTSAFGTSLFPVATIWGFAVALAIYSMGPLDSGAHFNPAITIAMALLRGQAANDLSIFRSILYMCAQVLGAVIASTTNLVIFGQSIKAYEKVNNIVTRGTASSASTMWGPFGEHWGIGVSSATAAFGVEALGTGILAFLIFNWTNAKNKSGPPASAVPALIGMTVTTLISVLAPLTQAGFNPARDFGPRLVTAFIGGWGPELSFKGWWVYVLGPIVGAIIGGALAEKVVWANIGEKRFNKKGR